MSLSIGNYVFICFFFLIANPLLVHLISLTMEGQGRAHFVRLGFFISAQLVMAIWSLIIWKRFTYLFQSMCGGRKFLMDVAKAVLVILIFGTHACFLTYYVLLGTEPHWFALFSFTANVFAFHLASFLLLFIFINYVTNSLSKRGWGRAFLYPFYKLPLVRHLCESINSQTLLALVIAVGLTAHGAYHSSGPPLVKPTTINLPNLPKEFDGFRIAHLTDLHVGPTVGRSRLKLVVDIVNKLEPDMVTVVGDLVDGFEDHLVEAVSPFNGLRSKKGTFFVTGNHEYYHGHISQWFAYLTAAGIEVLHNEHVKIMPNVVQKHVPNTVTNRKTKEPYFCLAGVDDHSAANSGVPGHKLDINAALEGCGENNHTVVVLCHQPRGARHILSTPHSVDLILAGHTHGGQLFLLSPISALSNPFFAGLYRTPSGAQVYVSKGVHFWGPPVKNSGLEISLITLRSAAVTGS